MLILLNKHLLSALHVPSAAVQYHETRGTVMLLLRGSADFQDRELPQPLGRGAKMKMQKRMLPCPPKLLQVQRLYQTYLGCDENLMLGHWSVPVF